MTDISNYAVYTTEMNKVMLDKLFFLSRVDADIFVDFGCADGTMIKSMNKLFPEHFYIGYDNDEQMIPSPIQFKPNIFFSTDWEKINTELNKQKEKRKTKTCLILSSIIHEIYSYEDEAGIKLFWQRVFETGFDFVVIRDMSVSIDTKYETYEDLSDLKAKFNQKHLAEFESVWGPVEVKRNLIHFLLKYRYVDNWDREVKENYFSYYPLAPILKAGEFGYYDTYFEQFTVPFIQRQIQNDFDFILTEPTHYKTILEKYK